MPSTLEELCELLHNEYEISAARNGWETQAKSRKPWSKVPEENKATMRDALRPVVERIKLETINEVYHKWNDSNFQEFSHWLELLSSGRWTLQE